LPLILYNIHVEYNKVNNNTVLSFLDVETTGLSVDANHRICEIAILKRYPDGKTTHWQTLINPKRPISAEAAKVNNITDEMVANAPLFEDVAKQILEMINDTVLICHNAKFDLKFLSTELSLCSHSMPDIPVVDTLKIARDHFNFPSNALGSIADYLSIKMEDKHRALADVYTTYRIFTYLIKELDSKGIEIDQLTKSCLTIY
jgi:DNA polymerase III subunit epsilon